MAELFTNLAESAITTAINNTTDPVTFNVLLGDGAKFPAAGLGSGNYFHAILDTGTAVEIVRCQRNGDAITADRAQEGTAKVTHSAGVRFAHAVTAAALQQIPAYIQANTTTTKGDFLSRTATGYVRTPIGANGTVPVANSALAEGWGWGSVGGATATQWQGADYTIFYDGTNYHARNNRTASEDVTPSNPSLHNVFNAAATNLGTGTSFTGEGGLIEFSTPAGHLMTTTAPLVMQNQLTVRGPGRGCVIRAVSGSWGGTLLIPTPMIDAYLKSRVKVEGLTLDCNGIAGTTGILFEKGTGSTGGNDAHSYFLFNEVRGFTISGIQIGRRNSAGATSTCWIAGNQVVDDVGSTAVGVGFYVGDAHYGWGNNIKVSSANGYPMYINADSVHVMGESHMVNNANCPHALITVVGGGHTRIQGIYFDNLRNFGAVDINTEGSGASNRTIITQNWCHLQSQTNYPGTASVFRLNAVNGGCSGVSITNNIGEADTETVRFTSILDITNGASNDIQNSLAMYGNSFQHVNSFITADNGPTSGAGSAAVGVGMNMIEDSNTGGGGNGSLIRLG